MRSSAVGDLALLQNAPQCGQSWGLSFSSLNPGTHRGFFLQREEWVPGESGCGSKMELRLELGGGGKPSTHRLPPRPHMLLRNLQTSLSRNRPVRQTGADAGNLGQRPGWSLGPCLMRWHLSTARPAGGVQGRTPCPPTGQGLRLTNHSSWLHPPRVPKRPSNSSLIPQARGGGAGSTQPVPRHP